MASTTPRIVIYLLRRDLRIVDNPVFHEISTAFKNAQVQASATQFTHLVPLYVLNPIQHEVSGFLKHSEDRSPYREARSAIGGFWRCGPHRAKFLSESLWALDKELRGLGSRLEIRIGNAADVVEGFINEVQVRTTGGEGAQVVGVWTTGEVGIEEKSEEQKLKHIVDKIGGVNFRLFEDEKYFIDDRDLPFCCPEELPDVFTTFRKTLEPLRKIPRPPLPKPISLPPLPPEILIPPQQPPFYVPATLPEFYAAFVKPLEERPDLKAFSKWPTGAESAHPFMGGEERGHLRIRYLLDFGSMTTYKDTRNGLLGHDYSTKLSAWLSLGCITARQIHSALVAFEDGTGPSGQLTDGYGKGENRGTGMVRFELLWGTYMRLCARKFGPKLFQVYGFRGDKSLTWKSPADAPDELRRFFEGTTGTGLIDASMRELALTGYTSNRARQNVASFLSKHLGFDWRLGAEWYEAYLVDYDVCSNWGNWQYVAGVGNDPRGGRVFNPIKQASDYDPRGEYITCWVPELRKVQVFEGVWQAWKVPESQREALGLKGLEMVENPLKRIPWVDRPKGRNNRGSKTQRAQKGPQRGKDDKSWRSASTDKAANEEEQSEALQSEGFPTG